MYHNIFSKIHRTLFVLRVFIFGNASVHNFRKGYIISVEFIFIYGEINICTT